MSTLGLVPLASTKGYKQNYEIDSLDFGHRKTPGPE